MTTSTAVTDVLFFMRRLQPRSPRTDTRFPATTLFLSRRSLTKFLATITIAVFREAIVSIFDAAKDGGPRMLYPILLLLAGVALIVGFGLYLRLSASAEQQIGGAKGEAQDEADYEAAQDDKAAAES